MIMRWVNIKRAVRCQYSHFRMWEWHFVQSHRWLLRFVFYHCRTWYTKLRYEVTFGEPLDLKNPKSFHAKLFWLSAMYRHPLIMQCADKYRVREYVKNAVGRGILNPLYGVYDSPRQIPFDTLPNRFAIKSNRGSGNTAAPSPSC